MRTAGEHPCIPAGCAHGDSISQRSSSSSSPFPHLFLMPQSVPQAQASQGTGRGTRLVRWLGTYQHLPAAPLPFSSRPHPLKGLMHLPLSCCEMQRLKNSSTGSPGRGWGKEGKVPSGADGSADGRSRQPCISMRTKTWQAATGWWGQEGETHPPCSPSLLSRK